MRCGVLGPLEVRGDDHEPIALPGAKERLLLAALAAASPGVLTVSRLSDLLWDGDPPPSARKSLQSHVVRLRSALEPGRPRGSPGRYVALRASGYALDITHDELDAATFVDAVEHGRSLLAGREVVGAAQVLTEALGLWRGDPYADWPEAPFAVAERRRLTEVRAGAREARFGALLALGPHLDLVPELERLVDDDPLREGSWSLLVTALYRSSRQADALHAVRRARVALAEQQGLDPGPRLRDLEQALLEQSPLLDPPEPPASLVPPSSATRLEAPADPFRALVGRERERAVLGHAFEGARGGHGRLVLLAGESGIGKTCLADALDATASSAGALVVWGQCWEAGGAPAFWPWTQSLRTLTRALGDDELRECLGEWGAEVAQLLPELRSRFEDVGESGSLSSDAARFRLFVAVGELLRAAARARPVVVVLEDLHVADAPSVLLLRFVADGLAGSRVLVLGTYRDVELRPDHALAASLPGLLGVRGASRLVLTGLAREDVAALVEAVAGVRPSERLVEALAAETEGNPLFVRETVQLLAAEAGLGDHPGPRSRAVPETVREVIGRRLDRLSAEARAALTVASVHGRDFTVGTLSDVLGGFPEQVLDALQDGLGARVVAEVPDEPGRFRFSHMLVRDTLYGRLSTAERVRLHRAVGRALENRYGPAPDLHLAELAHHFVEAVPGGDVATAVGYARRAGERAVTLLAFEEAARLFARALGALEHEPDERMRCALLLGLGDAQARAGESATARETFLEAAAAAARLGLPEELARAALGYGGRFVWMRAGTDPRLVPLLEQALAALPSGDGVLRVRLLSRLAGALRDEPADERRDALSREAVAVARRLGDPDTLMTALIGRWGAAAMGPDGLDEQRRLADELLRRARAAGDRERVMDACHLRLVDARTTGRGADAWSEYETYRRMAEALGQPSQRWQVGVMRAALDLQEGRLAEAEDLITRTYALGQRTQAGDAGASHLLALFVLRREQDRLAELEEALRRAPEDYPGYRGFGCMLVLALCERGRLDEARWRLDAVAEDDFGGLPKDNEWLSNLTVLAEAVDVFDDRARADVLSTLLAPYAGLVALAASEVSLGPVSRTLGVLAALRGRHEEASCHFADALAECRRTGARPWAARTEYGLARLLVARGGPGDDARARELFTRVLTTCRETGMVALERQADRRVAALRPRP